MGIRRKLQIKEVTLNSFVSSHILIAFLPTLPECGATRTSCLQESTLDQVRHCRRVQVAPHGVWETCQFWPCQWLFGKAGWQPQIVWWQLESHKECNIIIAAHTSSVTGWRHAKVASCRSTPCPCLVSKVKYFSRSLLAVWQGASWWMHILTLQCRRGGSQAFQDAKSIQVGWSADPRGANKGDLADVWLDLANAYACIPHKLASTVLARHHVPEKIEDLIVDN